MPQPPTTIDEYLATLPEEVRPVLQRVREAIRSALPEAEERVRYGMPAVMLDDRYAIHFAGWKKHVGVYPVGPLVEPLESEVAPYRSQKDSLRFVYAKPIPYELITRLTRELARRRSG
jgi:uncharacterized protein YdhG (YjbR/CyaY superfamily)